MCAGFIGPQKFTPEPSAIPSSYCAPLNDNGPLSFWNAFT